MGALKATQSDCVTSFLKGTIVSMVGILGYAALLQAGMVDAAVAVAGALAIISLFLWGNAGE